MRNVERIDGASYTPTARILLQNIDVRAEIISKKRVDSQKNTERTSCADYINENFFFVDEKKRSAGSAQTASTKTSFS